MKNRSPTNRPRSGISLIEVIACTALVAIMIVPIAGVIRASGQSLAQSSGNMTTETKLRNAMRWLRETVRDGTIENVKKNALSVRLADGSLTTIRIRRGNLVMSDGKEDTIVAQSVRDIGFNEIVRTTKPKDRIGVEITIQADDIDGNRVTIDATIAETPQI